MALRAHGQVVRLPLQEYLLLQLLMSHAGQILTRRYLLDHAWEPGHPDVHKTLEVYMYRLRGRLRAVGGPCPLRTVRRVGYVFDRATDY